MGTVTQGCLAQPTAAKTSSASSGRSLRMGPPWRVLWILEEGGKKVNPATEFWKKVKNVLTV
jgi:hypothetical protein